MQMQRRDLAGGNACFGQTLLSYGAAIGVQQLADDRTVLGDIVGNGIERGVYWS
jgi:hypothetical protein